MGKIKDLEQELEFLKRKEFINYYVEFNEWLDTMVWRPATYKERGTPSDFHYHTYDNYIDSLWGIEAYYHDTLNLSIRFMRDRYEHKYMIVGEFGGYSEVKTQDEMKTILGDLVRKHVTELRTKLDKIPV